MTRVIECIKPVNFFYRLYTSQTLTAISIYGLNRIVFSKAPCLTAPSDLKAINIS